MFRCVQLTCFGNKKINLRDDGQTLRQTVGVENKKHGVLSSEDSEAVVNALKRWQCARGVTSVYQLALDTNVPLATLRRWVKGNTRMFLAGVQSMLENLKEGETGNSGDEQAVADLERILTGHQSPSERLKDAFRKYNVRFVPVMRAIAEAGCRIVYDESGNEEIGHTVSVDDISNGDQSPLRPPEISKSCDGHP